MSKRLVIFPHWYDTKCGGDDEDRDRIRWPEFSDEGSEPPQVMAEPCIDSTLQKARRCQLA